VPDEVVDSPELVDVGELLAGVVEDAIVTVKVDPLDVITVWEGLLGLVLDELSEFNGSVVVAVVVSPDWATSVVDEVDVESVVSDREVGLDETLEVVSAVIAVVVAAGPEPVDSESILEGDETLDETTVVAVDAPVAAAADCVSVEGLPEMEAPAPVADEEETVLPAVVEPEMVGAVDPPEGVETELEFPDCPAKELETAAVPGFADTELVKVVSAGDWVGSGSFDDGIVGVAQVVGNPWSS
jgi:hypothetical protein